MILATFHQASGPIEPELLAASFELDHDPAGWGTLCAQAVVRVTEVLTATSVTDGCMMRVIGTADCGSSTGRNEEHGGQRDPRAREGRP